MNITALKALSLSLTLAALVLLGHLASPANAVSIGLNLTYNGNAADANSTDPTIMAAGDTTGVVTQGNWNTVTFRDWYDSGFFSPVLGVDTTKEGHPTSGVLIDSTGASTSVNVKSDVGLNWYTSTNAAYAGSTATVQLLFGFAQSNGGPAPAYSINGLSAGKYDIYAYFSTNSDTNTIASLTGGASYYLSVPTGQASAFTQVTNTTSGDFTHSGNYVEWTGVSPVSGTISFSVGGPSGAQGAGLAGLQIVSEPTPEPSSFVLLGCAAIAIAWVVRRKQGGN